MLRKGSVFLNNKLELLFYVKSEFLFKAFILKCFENKFDYNTREFDYTSDFIKSIKNYDFLVEYISFFENQIIHPFKQDFYNQEYLLSNITEFNREYNIYKKTIDTELKTVFNINEFKKYLIVTLELLKELKKELNKLKRKYPSHLIKKNKEVNFNVFIIRTDINNLNLFFLRKTLINQKLIEKKTNYNNFINVFKGEIPTNKINWTGTKNELSTFILILKKFRVVSNANHFKACEKLFLINNKEIINLRTPKIKDYDKCYNRLNELLILVISRNHTIY